MAKVWEALARSSPAIEVYEKRLTELLQEMGCAAKGAPYVVRGLLFRLESENSPFDKQSLQLPTLAKAFLDEEHCPGVRGLPEDEKARFKAIRDRSPPTASKQ